jgi:uncharacterized protein (DUF1499 family)
MPRIRINKIFAIVALVLTSPVVLLAILSATAKKPPNLGVVNGRLAACPDTPNCVSTQATDAEHHIEPIPFDELPGQAIQRLKAAIAGVPRMRIIEEKDGYMYAEAKSPIFRFVDDVEFYVDRNAKVIHFRSASRVGHSDLGVNRKRMEQFRQALLRGPATTKQD